MLPSSCNISQVIGGPTPLFIRPPSPPVIGIPDVGLGQSLSLGDHLPPQVIYKPNNQEITYKQNVIVRWLRPPTPPPSAPIIIREIQCPPEIPPPIIYRQVPPCPPTPPPIIIREQPPPPCPSSREPLIIDRCLPRTCLPRQVIVERCPPPTPKPQTIIYERYLPPPPPPQEQRQIIVQRDTCQPTVCSVAPQRRLVREIVRQVPRQCVPAQPALVCTSQKQQRITPGPSQVVQQLVPVFANRQRIVQPKGIRIIRQVVGPAQPSAIGQVGIQQQLPQFCPITGSPYIRA